MFQLVIIFLFVNYVPPTYGDYVLPEYAESIGWLLALGPSALIPLTMVVMFFWRSGGCQVGNCFPINYTRDQNYCIHR